MTTVSEVLEGQFGGARASAAGSEGAGTGAPVRARVAVTVGDGKGSSRVAAAVAGFGRTVAADVAAAWPWRGTPPALAEMWAGRVPALDEVPGRNRVLWVGWSVYNHAVLPVVAVSYVALWVLAHPARFGLAAAVAAPIIYLWI